MNVSRHECDRNGAAINHTDPLTVERIWKKLDPSLRCALHRAEFNYQTRGGKQRESANNRKTYYGRFRATIAANLAREKE